MDTIWLLQAFSEVLHPSIVYWLNKIEYIDSPNKYYMHIKNKHLFCNWMIQYNIVSKSWCYHNKISKYRYYWSQTLIPFPTVSFKSRLVSVTQAVVISACIYSVVYLLFSVIILLIVTRLWSLIVIIILMLQLTIACYIENIIITNETVNDLLHANYCIIL